MADDKVNVHIGFDAKDLAEAEAQIMRLEELGRRVGTVPASTAASATAPGRRAVRNPWGTYSAAEGAVESVKARVSATPKSRPGIVGSILRTAGLIPPGSSGSLAAIAQQGPVEKFVDTAALKSGLFSDPSVGGFNQSGLAGAASSAKARGLLYRARAVALGNPLALFRSVLAVWALKQATDYGKDLLSDASKNFSTSDTAKNFDAIGLSARDKLQETGDAIAEGFGKTKSAIGSIFAIGAGGLLGTSAYLGTTWGTTRDRERQLGSVAAETDDFIQRLEFLHDRKNSRIQKLIDYREGVSARRGQVIDRAAELLERSRTEFMESGFLNEIQRKGGGSVESLSKFFDPVAKANFNKAVAEVTVGTHVGLPEIQFLQRPDNGTRVRNYPYYR